MTTDHLTRARAEPPPAYLDRDLPPLWARGLALLLLLLFGTAAVAAVVVRLPETVSGPFRLTAREGGVDPVRAPRDGFVSEIRVAEAQQVSKGETLFVIRAPAGREQAEELAALRAHRDSAADGLARTKREHDAQRLRDDEEEQRLQARAGQLAREIAAARADLRLQEEIDQADLAAARFDLESARKETDLQRKVLAGAQEASARAPELLKQKSISAFEVFQLQDEAARAAVALARQERELEATRQKPARLALQQKSRKAQQDVRLTRLQDQISANEAARAGLRRRREDAERHNAERERVLQETIKAGTARITALTQGPGGSPETEVVVASPGPAAVVRRNVKGIGAFVRTGEVLCELAGAGESLQVEWSVPQSEVGRLDTGQRVKLLYDAFPYQRYGIRYGTVRWISPAGIDGGGRTGFRVLVDPDEEPAPEGSLAKHLRVGMGGRAEVVIGRQSLLSRLLPQSP
jgi:membrane fusion protein